MTVVFNVGSNNSNSAARNIATSSMTPDIGDVIVVIAVAEATGITATCTDTSENTYRPIAAVNAGTWSIFAFKARATQAVSTTWTVAFSATVVNAAYAHAYTGGDASYFPGEAEAAVGSSTTPGGGVINVPIGCSILMSASVPGTTQPTGFTVRETTGNVPGQSADLFVYQLTKGENPTWTIATGTWAACNVVIPSASSHCGLPTMGCG